MQDQLRRKAQQALNKKASLGEEIDLDQFSAGGKEHPYLNKLEELAEEDKEDMLIAGVDTSEKERTGSFILEDNTVVHASVFQEELEVWVEVSDQVFSDEIRKLESLEQEIRREIEVVLGISVKVKLVEPKTIERYEGKAKRIIDRRSL
jgi:hypothetical protein